MSLVKLIISAIAVIASCQASGFGVVPAVRSFPIVRYSPFYSFPGAVRSIHAVSPAFPAVAAPAPALAPAPVLPAPAFAPAPVFGPAPVFPAPAPAFAPPPGFPAPAFAPPPGFPTPAFAPAPVFPAPAPVFSPFPRFAAPALPVPAPAFLRAPFSPIVRPVAAAPVFPAPAPPLFDPASAPHIAFARAFPGHVHLNRYVGPAQGFPAPVPQAWK